ncbi:MAG TPA: TolC family protein, partial [Tepidisphaeraceae bacterium]|nr:TolC family protein [Tepidisphaeraceae bacterium]
LENNLDLKVELINPTVARESVNEEEARFEALFTTDLRYATTDAPTATELVGSQAKDLSITPGITLPLRTGGSLSFSVPMDRFETNNSFATLNPSFSSDVQATFTQPLLRGAGAYYNEQPIRVAKYNYLQSQARTKLEVIRVLTDVDRVYWRLYAARQQLRVSKKQYDLAVAQYERAQRQAQAGAVANVEVTRAESGVADQREAIITAENTVRDRERDLKRLLNDADLPMESDIMIIPQTEPKTLYYKVHTDELMQHALTDRMEMLDLELQIAEETSNVTIAKNDLLPLVSLEYTYGINGLGGDFGESFTMVRDRNFQDHRLGIRLEVPLGNEAARSRLRRALAVRLQALATKEQRSIQIRQELAGAIDQLNTNWYRILAAKKRTELAVRVVELEIREFNQGLRTSTDVIDAQTRLASAASAEISAVTDYQISQVDIAFATGTVLGASRVIWEPTAAPKLDP